LKPKNSPTPDLFEVRIDSLSYNGGRGVGRFEGVVVFVPGTAPGDVVRARVTVRKSNLVEAELVEILEPSAHRREPPCAVAHRCGGCSWQHVAYVEQVRQKENILRASLRRVATSWLPFLAAPEEFDYRNRIQLHVSGERWGFYAAKSRELVEFDRCWIAERALNEEKAKRRPREFGAVDRVEIARLESGEVRVMAGRRDPGAALFSQVNTRQNQVLRGRVRALAHGVPDWFMDLYAGAGNFTGVLRELAPNARGLAVEFSRISVERGAVAEPTTEWVAGDVARVLSRRPVPVGAGLVLLDPPRAGVDAAVIEHLGRLRPRQILYVSCNPATFARDAERLVNDAGFELECTQGLDMFPQTEHVELIASFRDARGVLA